MPPAGIAIAIYEPARRALGERPLAGYGVVDDRRWVDVVAGRSLELADIDPGAQLASLVVERLAGPGELRIGACRRDRVPAVRPADRFALERTGKPAPDRYRLVTVKQPAPPPRYDALVRCAVSGASGRHLVRVAYVSTALRYRAAHDVWVAATDRARVQTAIAIAMPARRDAAVGLVVAYDGVPGGERAPRELARGEVPLDGSIAVVAAPARDVAVELVRIAPAPGETTGGRTVELDTIPFELRSGEAGWVWVWLVAPQLALAAGQVHVHVVVADEARDVIVPDAAREQAPRSGGVRLPLWLDDSVRVTRQRFELPDADGHGMRVAIAATNIGDAPREVWIEQRVVRAHRRRVEDAFPAGPIAHGDVLRTKLVVAPGAIARAGYVIRYDP